MNVLVLLGAVLHPAPPALPPSTTPYAFQIDDTGARDPDGRPGGAYLQVGGGLVTTEDSDGPDEDVEFDEGYLVSVALGHRFASSSPLAFDLELEGVWTDQDADDDGALQAVNDVTSIGALVNGLVDFRMTRSISLYGGAGIGATWLDIGTESDALNDFDDEDGPFLTWQAKAGVAFAIARSAELRVGYRFHNIDDAEIDDGIGDSSFDLETSQHVLEVGLRFGLSRS